MRTIFHGSHPLSYHLLRVIFSLSLSGEGRVVRVRGDVGGRSNEYGGESGNEGIVRVQSVTRLCNE